jgi:hypothetical protein
MIGTCGAEVVNLFIYSKLSSLAPELLEIDV